MAYYFGLPHNVVQVAWMYAFFVHLAGFWLYILLWAVLPKSKKVPDDFFLRTC